jgi:hypothetical protein
MPTATLEKPASVVTAVRILYLVVAIGVGRVVIAVVRHADVRSPDFLILTKVFFYAAAIFLISRLGRGKNWARWTLATLLAIGIPLTVLPALDAISHSTLNTGLVLLQLGLYIAAMALVFRQPSSTWFGAMHTSQQ